MNKKIGFILALVFIAFLVMGSASAGIFDFLNGGNNNSPRATNDNNTFIVGFDTAFPPFEYENSSGDSSEESSSGNNSGIDSGNEESGTVEKTES